MKREASQETQSYVEHFHTDFRPGVQTHGSIPCASLECRNGGWRIEVGYFRGKPLHLVRSGFVFVSLSLLAERSEVVAESSDAPDIHSLIRLEDVRVNRAVVYFSGREMLVPLREGESCTVEFLASDGVGGSWRYLFGLSRRPLGRIEFSRPLLLGAEVRS